MPKPYRLDTDRLKSLIALEILRSSLVMISTIQFNCQPCLLAVKIKDCAFERMLPAELETIKLSCSQMLP